MKNNITLICSKFFLNIQKNTPLGLRSLQKTYSQGSIINKVFNTEQISLPIPTLSKKIWATISIFTNSVIHLPSIKMKSRRNGTIGLIEKIEVCALVFILDLLLNPVPDFCISTALPPSFTSPLPRPPRLLPWSLLRGLDLWRNPVIEGLCRLCMCVCVSACVCLRAEGGPPGGLLCCQLSPLPVCHLAGHDWERRAWKFCLLPHERKCLYTVSLD